MKYAKFLRSCFSVPATNDLASPPKKVLNSESNELQNFEHQQQQLQREQHVIVMRHGDRIDHAQPRWLLEAKTPWDPPLCERGNARAFSTGKNLKNNLPIPIHRVIVSPFIRCIQTALEVVSAFRTPEDDDNAMNTASVNSHLSSVNSHLSMVKVSIEYGLCEMLNGEAIRPDLAPKKGKFNFNILELEAKFLPGTVDQTVEPVCQKLPLWEESIMDARARFERVIRALSDKYPSENLLIVTHGEGVRVAVSAFLEDTVVHEVETCAYAHLKRQVCFSSSRMFTAENFEVITKNGQSGIRFGPLSDVTLDV